MQEIAGLRSDSGEAVRWSGWLGGTITSRECYQNKSEDERTQCNEKWPMRLHMIHGSTCGIKVLSAHRNERCIGHEECGNSGNRK